MDADKYVDLLNSVGQQGLGSGRKRPLSPVECALAIQRIIDEEGESLDEISERLGLGKPKNMSNIYKKRDTTQLTMFLNLLKVSEKSRSLAGWTTDDSLVPFSTIAQLSSLTEKEQDVILQSIRKLGKEDVQKIKKWRNENPELPIEECIEKVFKLKPVTVITHLAVMEIQPLLRNFLESNLDPEDRLLEMLQNNLSGKFHSVKVGKSVVIVSMDEEAFKPFHACQHDEGLSYTAFFNKFLEGQIG